MTKKYKRLTILFRTLSILVTLLPIIIFGIIAFVQGSVGQKVTLGVCLLTVFIMTIINIIFKHHIRCTIWIALLGISTCLNNLVPLLLVMAITVAIDEFILVPLVKRNSNLYKINKEIDKRSPECTQEAQNAK